MLAQSTLQSQPSILKENILTLTMLYFGNKLTTIETQADLKLKYQKFAFSLTAVLINTAILLVYKKLANIKTQILKV